MTLQMIRKPRDVSFVLRHSVTWLHAARKDLPVGGFVYSSTKNQLWRSCYSIVTCTTTDTVKQEKQAQKNTATTLTDSVVLYCCCLLLLSEPKHTKPTKPAEHSTVTLEL